MQTVITDYHRFSSEATFGDSFLANTLVTADPPDHRTLRSLVNQAFTPRAEIDGERLSQQELVNFCFLLLAAGQETTQKAHVKYG